VQEINNIFCLFQLIAHTLINKCYIYNVLLSMSVLPEDCVCRPKHVGEITTTYQIVINGCMCS